MSNEVTKPVGTAVGAVSNPWTAKAEDQKDLIFPRAKIFQGTASEFEAYPSGKPGIIINHITGEPLPSTFIPFLKFKQYAKFNPRNSADAGFNPAFEPGALMWITTDSTDPRTEECKFSEDGEKPTAIEFMNFMCLFEGAEFPIIVPFAKTSYKAGKKLFSMLTFSGGGFKRKFTLSSKKMQKDGQTYYVFDVNPAGMATDEESAKAEAAYNQFHASTEKIKPENETPFAD